uniref:Uncharacterized protein n=1 Tax=Vespula pensylvanica TaxID=30213 RepID=A0A834UDZ3_VESPE|nr:hypothetical protein H0235_002630 [Vespula pensylvanica]
MVRPPCRISSPFLTDSEVRRVRRQSLAVNLFSGLEAEVPSSFPRKSSRVTGHSSFHCLRLARTRWS